MQDLALQRMSMVTDQLEARNIKDSRVLAAMLKVERHRFVPADQLHSAYADSPLPIGEGQTISQPYMVALMTELLTLQGREKVLEIGTGCGYQTAVLSELVREVYTVERSRRLADQAQMILNELGYQNIRFLCGDGFAGWSEHSPFDAILVTCAPDEIPGELFRQLAEGGRMSIPVGSDWQELKLVRKISGNLHVEGITAVRFVPMVKGQG